MLETVDRNPGRRQEKERIEAVNGEVASLLGSGAQTARGFGSF